METPATPPAASSEPEREAIVQRTPRRRKRGRGYYRSGFYALKTTLRALGPRVVDKRTHLGKQLAAWRDDLVRDLGGDLSTQERVLVDLAVRQKLLVESVDAWLLTQRSLVNSRKRALIPVLRERQALADGLARLLGQLGLQRRARPVPSLHDYLAAKAAQAAAESRPKADDGDGARKPAASSPAEPLRDKDFSAPR